MKKGICLLSALILITCVVLTGCSGGENQDGENTAPKTTSFEEKRSYYDELVKGEIEVEIATTASRNSDFEFTGNTDLLPKKVLSAIEEKLSKCYGRVYSKYGANFNVPHITVHIDSGYASEASNYAVGSTIYINPDWFIENVDDVAQIFYGMVKTMQVYQASCPEWLERAIQYYIRAEYDSGTKECPFSLPSSYEGISYEDDPLHGAAFLRWINSFTEGDFVQRLNKALQNGNYNDSFWATETGLSLDALWQSYKTNSNVAQ